MLIEVVRKIELAGVWLPDETRILVDSSLPKPKQEWTSFHEAVHRILEWHRPFFLGDTAQTLDPAYQEVLELEANYGASALMFCGPAFARDARDVAAGWSGFEKLKKRYRKSYVTTLRRFVEHGQDRAMAMLVSTPAWKEKPSDQKTRCRHFVCSHAFMKQFSSVSAEWLLARVDENACERVGGPVADFLCCEEDDNGDAHEFKGESFFNRHYLLTLFVQARRLRAKKIVIPGVTKLP